MPTKPSIHIHHYVHLGIEYRLLDKLAGSNANPVIYYDVFFCSECLHKKWISRGIIGDSYQMLSGATPLSENAELEGD